MTCSLIGTGLFLKKAVQGEGEVLWAIYLHGRAGGWKLKVKYQPTDLQMVEATFWPNDDQSYYAGETVHFLYDPDDFTKLRSLDVARQYPWAHGLFILVFLALAGFGWMKYKRAKLDEKRPAPKNPKISSVVEE